MPLEQNVSFLSYAIMEAQKTALERAFELARTGKCLSIADIVKRLKQENYPIVQIEGPSLKKQLLRIIEEAKRSP